jgi:hypothetical protein
MLGSACRQQDARARLRASSERGAIPFASASSCAIPAAAKGCARIWTTSVYQAASDYWSCPADSSRPKKRSRPARSGPSKRSRPTNKPSPTKVGRKLCEVLFRGDGRLTRARAAEGDAPRAARAWSTQAEVLLRALPPEPAACHVRVEGAETRIRVGGSGFGVRG